jgi:hypothetical protein
MPATVLKNKVKAIRSQCHTISSDITHMNTECANTTESRKSSVVKAKNSWMKLNCLGCTVGNTLMP